MERAKQPGVTEWQNWAADAHRVVTNAAGLAAADRCREARESLVRLLELAVTKIDRLDQLIGAGHEVIGGPSVPLDGYRESAWTGSAAADDGSPCKDAGGNRH